MTGLQWCKNCSVNRTKHSPLHWGPLELRIAEARGVRADVRRVGSLDFDIDTTFDEYTIYSLEHKAPSQHIVYTSQYQCPNCEVLAEG